MTQVQQHGLSADARALMAFQSKRRSVGLAYVFWVFLGGLGAHRYYNGRVGSGIAIAVLNLLGWIMLGAGGFGLIFILPVAIWVVVDAFLIPGWVSSHNARLLADLDGGASATLVTAS